MVRKVTLYHKELDRETRQPLSAARNLEASGWEIVDDDVPAEAASDADRPPVNAPKKEWVEFAKSRGDKNADAKNKEDLVEQHGKDDG